MKEMKATIIALYKAASLPGHGIGAEERRWCCGLGVRVPGASHSFGAELVCDLGQITSLSVAFLPFVCMLF